MVFTSPTFLFLFLPLFVAAFLAVSRRDRLTLGARLVIVGGTYLFYAFENVNYLVPFTFATVMDLVWSRALSVTNHPKLRRLIVTASVLQNLGLLFIYKYSGWMGAPFGPMPLPPGISFYLFESLSFVIDCYRRRIQTPRNPFNFLTFITMFPRFIAGPIVRYADLEASIERYQGVRMGDGLFVFAVGFVIKILLADSLDRIVAPYFGRLIHFSGAWITSLAYTFQLYLDFSAYSLMAIGLGLMIGFPFPDNFREPYRAGSITEFWRRWHISLSTWLRDYLYIPLGGNQAGPKRAYLNLILTMTLGGLWHGANMTFVIWGVYHGLLLALEKLGRTKGFKLDSPALTFFLVVIGWTYFRAERAHQGLLMVAAMMGLKGAGWGSGFKILQLNLAAVSLGAVGIGWAMVIEPWLRRRRGGRAWNELCVERVPVPVLGCTVILFGMALLLALANRNVPFLYFQF